MSPKIVDRDARRRRILNAATQVFARHGYQTATIDQIAAEAGVAKGSIYLAFKSKEDLFFALFEDFIQSTVEPGAMEHSDDTSALAKLERLLLGAAAAIDADEAVIPLTLEFWSVCGVEQTRERFGRQYEALFSAYRGLLVGLLEEAKTQGEIDANVPSMALASCLIAMIDGLLIQQWTAEEIKASVVLHEALPVLLGSLRRKP